MNRLSLMLLLCLIALVLTACGGKDGEKAAAGTQAAQQVSTDAAQAEKNIAEASLLSDEEVIAETVSQEGTTAPVKGEALPGETAPVLADANRPVDLDLTKISGTVVYSQVYDMIMEPDAYMGQKIKMKGSFSYFKDPDTHQEYFAAVIADATACCSQGIEFVWKGKHSYPQDYPPLDTEITVIGSFDTYYEGDYKYVRLTDADVKW